MMSEQSKQDEITVAIIDKRIILRLDQFIKNKPILGPLLSKIKENHETYISRGGYKPFSCTIKSFEHNGKVHGWITVFFEDILIDKTFLSLLSYYTECLSFSHPEVSGPEEYVTLYKEIKRVNEANLRKNIILNFLVNSTS